MNMMFTIRPTNKLVVMYIVGYLALMEQKSL